MPPAILDAGTAKDYSETNRARTGAPSIGDTMPEKIVRYEPFTAADGDWPPLLAFAEQAAPLLCPGFSPSASRTPEWVEPEGEPYYWTRRGWRQGDAERGFAVTFTQTIEPMHDGVAASGVSVQAYGLPAGVALSITCERKWFDPRYLELNVSGPQEAVDGAARAFDDRFGPIARRVPEPDELDTELVGIRSALKRRQWEAAEKRAAYVLRFRPDDPEALFALGVAAGAGGDAKRALGLLTRAVERAPGHHDAWYNLGIAYLELGEPKKAVDALERALMLSPGNKDIERQLGRANKAAIGSPKT